jgi:hypothetical protein
LALSKHGTSLYLWCCIPFYNLKTSHRDDIPYPPP